MSQITLRCQIYIFKWFKFTLKPPNSMVIGNFILAIWDTSHWNFFVKFGHKTPSRTSSRTLFGQFWHMSIFGDSRAVWVLLPNFVPSENQFFLNEGATGLQSFLGVLGGQVARLYGGTIFGGATHLGGPAEHRKQRVCFSTHLQQLKWYSAFTDLIKNQSIGVL